MHNGKYPLIGRNLIGGIIIDLPTKEVESEVTQLLDIHQRKTDEELCIYLENLAMKIKGETTKEGKSTVNLLNSTLLQ